MAENVSLTMLSISKSLNFVFAAENGLMSFLSLKNVMVPGTSGSLEFVIRYCVVVRDSAYHFLPGDNTDTTSKDVGDTQESCVDGDLRGASDSARIIHLSCRRCFVVTDGPTT